MTPKERMLAALHREKPDRLPVTVHQWQGYHLEEYMGGVEALEALDRVNRVSLAAGFPLLMTPLS